MKFYLFTFILLFSAIVFAQDAENTFFQSGKVELNFLIDAGKMSTTYEANNSYQKFIGSSRAGYLLFSVLPGFFVADGLSIEPEISILALEDAKPSFSIIPNLSYTYLIPQSRIALYSRAGYGLSNSRSLFGLLIRNSDKMDIGILNFGTGIKYLVSAGAALRIELNYKRTSQERDFNEFTENTTLQTFRLLFGFSVLL
jgi:hypothetical protein